MVAVAGWWREHEAVGRVGRDWRAMRVGSPPSIEIKLKLILSKFILQTAIWHYYYFIQVSFLHLKYYCFELSK